MARPLRPGDKVRLKIRLEDLDAGEAEGLVIVDGSVLIEAVIKEITAGQAVVTVGDAEIHIGLGEAAMGTVVPTRWDS